MGAETPVQVPLLRRWLLHGAITLYGEEQKQTEDNVLEMTAKDQRSIFDKLRCQVNGS